MRALPGAYLTQTPTEEGFKLVITSQFYVPAVDAKGFLTVSLPELELMQQQELAFSGAALNASLLNKVEVKSELAISGNSVQLWWPAGGNYGPHKLYVVDVSFTPEGHKCSAVAPEHEQQLEETSLDEPVVRSIDGLKKQPEAPSSGVETDKVQSMSAEVEDLQEAELQEPISPDEANAALEFADVDRQLASQQQRRLLAADAVQQISPVDAAVAAQVAAAGDAEPHQPQQQPQQQAQQAQQQKAAQQEPRKKDTTAAWKSLLGSITDKFLEHKAQQVNPN